MTFQTHALRAAALDGVATLSPGFVPAGVTRPPVLRFGGAITPRAYGTRRVSSSAPPRRQAQRARKFVSRS